MGRGISGLKTFCTARYLRKISVARVRLAEHFERCLQQAMSPIGTKRPCQNASTMSALGGNPDGICSLRAFPLLTQSGRRLASRAITTNALLGRDFSHPEVRTKGRPAAARGRLHAQAVAA